MHFDAVSHLQSTRTDFMCCCLKILSNFVSNSFGRAFDRLMDVVYCKGCGQCDDHYHCDDIIQGDKNGRIPSIVVEEYMLQENDNNVVYDMIELENYYKNVDRNESEKLLEGQPVGTCLVRPFKMKVSRTNAISDFNAHIKKTIN